MIPGNAAVRVGSARLGPRRVAALIVYGLLVLLPGRIAMPPLDRDESRYMEATSQMIASGDLVDVRFQDRPRYLQPAGIYWLEAAAVSTVEAMTGSAAPRRQAWAYRIPSLIAGVADVVLTASIGTALFGADIGFLGAILFGASVLFAALGRMATIDTVLLTAVLVAERALLDAWRDREARRPTGIRTGLVFWGAIGCGLMLKGPVVLIPVMGALGFLSVAVRDLDLWRRTRPGFGIPLAIAIAAPWLVAISIASDGRFLATAIGTNLLGKIAGGQQAHGAPIGTYLGLFPASFWPGSLFAVLAVPFVWARRRQHAVLFLLAAIVPHWIVYELIATKLPHYVLPTYPAIALLTAAFLRAPKRPVVPKPPVARVLAGLGTAYGALWLVAGLAFAAAGPVLVARLQGGWSAGAIGTAGVGAALIVAAAVLVFRRAFLPGALVSVGAAMVLYAGLFFAVVPNLTTIWLSPRIARTVDQVKPCAGSVLASSSFSEPSLVFLVGQDTRLELAGEAARFLASDRCGMALIGQRDEAAFRHALTVPVRKLGEIDGVNYSTGKRLALSLYTAQARP